MEIGEEIVKKIDSSLRYIKTLRPSSTLVYQVEKKWIIKGRYFVFGRKWK